MIRRGATEGDRFAQVLNAALQDDRLSYRARGVLAAVISRPKDWHGTAKTLADDSPTEGREAIQTALRELETHGYLRRVKSQGERGLWRTDWMISDNPTLIQPAEEQQGLDITFPQVAPETGLPTPVQPTPVQPTPDNPSSSKHGYQTRSVPNGTGRRGARPAAAATPEAAVAKAVYDHTQGMVEFIAIQKIARRALKVSGTTVDLVADAMTTIYDHGRPITFQTVGQHIAGHSQPGSRPGDQQPAPAATRIFDNLPFVGGDS